jgi:hypothetical protein
MTMAEAVDRAQGVLSQLGIDPGPLRQTEINKLHPLVGVSAAKK